MQWALFWTSSRGDTCELVDLGCIISNGNMSNGPSWFKVTQSLLLLHKPLLNRFIQDLYYYSNNIDL